MRWRVSGLQLAAGVNLVAQVIGQQVGTKHKIYIPVLIFQTIIFTFFSYLLEEELCKNISKHKCLKRLKKAMKLRSFIVGVDGFIMYVVYHSQPKIISVLLEFLNLF